MDSESSAQWLQVWITGVNGKSDVTLKAGETCHIPAKQVHFGKTGSERVTFLSIHVQETGTPQRCVDAEERAKHGL
jgi:mannose-6-phosphate isomerase-like protein (cupin superfamily)